MVTTKNTILTQQQFIEVLTQVVSNPIELKSTDFMTGMVCDSEGKPQKNVKDLSHKTKYWFLAYQEVDNSMANKGIPDYTTLPKYAIPFMVKDFDEKGIENFFIGVRAVLNAASTIFDFGVYCQDQAMGKVVGSVQYNKKKLDNPNLFISSYIQSDNIAFIMTVTET